MRNLHKYTLYTPFRCKKHVRFIYCGILQALFRLNDLLDLAAYIQAKKKKVIEVSGRHYDSDMLDIFLSYGICTTAPKLSFKLPTDTQ